MITSILIGFLISAAIATAAAWLVTLQQRRREIKAILARYELDIASGTFTLEELWVDGYSKPSWRRW